MDQSLTLFTWFSGLLFLLVCILDVLLALKLRRYFRANGYGIVTVTLVSLILAHGVAAMLFGITSLTVIATAGNAQHTIHLLKDVASIWLISSEFLHVMGFTFQRIMSCSCAEDFIEFTRSKTNIAISISTMWIVPLILTLLCATSRSPQTYSVFYLGVVISGCLVIANFSLTIDTGTVTIDELNEVTNRRKIKTSTPKQHVRVVSNPRKTFTLFSGLMFSFVLFVLPTAIPNLIYNLQGKSIKSSTSLIVSLWLFLGVVFDCMWIVMRLRSTINDTTGFYARWTLGSCGPDGTAVLKRFGESREKLARGKFGKEGSLEQLFRRDSLDSKGQETEVEHL